MHHEQLTYVSNRLQIREYSMARLLSRLAASLATAGVHLLGSWATNLRLFKTVCTSPSNTRSAFLMSSILHADLSTAPDGCGGTIAES